ncbi:flagellar biosynthesis protein FlhF [Anaerobacillus isosaccharinicus]|uniref:Flagellar biosynthesis protein FlhF n=1 Tax=Anaerobacillus isosaccharinicus TaxID=1532552 RepID=A0A1S2L6G3_9BACI|nr:flagellar biosynthesis protein FlhF [Anaerobacillus isosaccharinicus]MBA5587318.1 flagellar biosynthesis protein FlhF [Anaerobacillus isosaccharinicus]QOY34489.1 flagellar biosynthesis protein FlhF [Anaerobacillus isosaccharinicus]
MKVKKFVAKSMSEAMKKIRTELGSEAVILNSKEVETGGFLGFFTKKNIEVIAAVDTAPAVRRPAPKKTSQTQPSPKPPVTKNTLTKQELTKVESINASKNGMLEKEVKELKDIVNGISSSIATQFDDYPEILKKINQVLINQDISLNIRIDVMKKLLKKWYILDKETTSEEEVLQWVREVIKETIQPNNMGGFNFNKKFLNLVGPTGVGKTTTIAKIAAHCVLKHNKKVAFITTDTFRIAAIDQLKTYAKILNVPVEIAYSVEDFKKAKEKLSGYDLVLIDSAGRNFLNELYIEELKKVINFDEEMETYLVLSLTSKYRDMATIYEQFAKVNINKVIFTKKDETFSRGAMINLVHEYNVGVSYITNGQSVPDDILEGSVEEIVNSIIEVDNYE